ncbi:MAG: TetR/AcrR family transcriptional regulator [Acidobacteriota bacterium]
MTDSSTTASASADKATDRRRRDPEATRQAILDAAETLFVEHGLDGTPTSRIARHAGVTKSLIHHHFGSKEALWTEIKERHWAAYYALQKAMLQNTRGSAALLEASIRAYFDFLRTHPDMVRIFSWRFAEEDHSSVTQEVELFQLGVERIQEAQEAGELREDIDPTYVLKSFLALCLHWFQSHGMTCSMFPPGDERASHDRYIQQIVGLIFDGIRAPD